MVAIIITFIMHKELSLGNKNTGILWDKNMSSVNWLSPQGSYRRTEISTRHFCKTPVRVTKNVKWAISWKPPMLMKWTKGKITRTLPQKAAGYRRELTTAWLRCVPGRAYVNRSYKLTSIYDTASRSSVSQNTRNECTIQKKKKVSLLHCSIWGFIN